MLNAKCQIENKIQELLPFLFGREIKEHVLVNNWENGWIFSNASNSSDSGNSGNVGNSGNAGSSSNSGNADSVEAQFAGPTALAGPAGLASLPDLPSNQGTIVLFFMPQLLEWIGFFYYQFLSFSSLPAGASERRRAPTSSVPACRQAGIGFALLPLPFLFLFFKRNRTP